ncbi:sporulation protein [Streptomyces sp. DSM 44915]|uniref:Sporulation protein n=1 Tax=Streptomyces chisholmiae TaxID=3075540 RepID=A0ABU2JXU9_9ACTN|nr:sporulation protein [Streptomyces sp. DSM 44915]MDT0269777.1 sporulation protein [Streptomyces sp. DSM 44915]
MVFKRLLGKLGVGGPSVDTVLHRELVLPGETVSGDVLVRGGSMDVEITEVTLDLAARVEAEGGGEEHQGTVRFHRVVVGGGFRLAEEQQLSIPFSFPLPWETPITEVFGQPLTVPLGVRTELAVAGAVDQGDLDPLRIRPLPVQEAVLNAFGQLGFGFRSADLELGQIRGTGQTLPFYQEIELTPGQAYLDSMREVEISFLANPAGLTVVLEADRRGGYFGGGGDALNTFSVRHEDVQGTDFTALVDSWLRTLVERRGAFGGGQPGFHGHEHGHGEHKGGGGLAGIGGAVAGLAAGVVGGMVAAEIIDEIGDAFEGD